MRVGEAAGAVADRRYGDPLALLVRESGRARRHGHRERGPDLGALALGPGHERAPVLRVGPAGARCEALGRERGGAVERVDDGRGGTFGWNRGDTGPMGTCHFVLANPTEAFANLRDGQIRVLLDNDEEWLMTTTNTKTATLDGVRAFWGKPWKKTRG